MEEEKEAEAFCKRIIDLTEEKPNDAVSILKDERWGKGLAKVIAVYDENNPLHNTCITRLKPLLSAPLPALCTQRNQFDPLVYHCINHSRASALRLLQFIQNRKFGIRSDTLHYLLGHACTYQRDPYRADFYLNTRRIDFAIRSTTHPLPIASTILCLVSRGLDGGGLFRKALAQTKSVTDLRTIKEDVEKKYFTSGLGFKEHLMRLVDDRLAEASNHL